MKVFSVSEINRVIKDLLDNEIMLEDISVTGELSSFSVTRGIAYFTLKDNDNLLNCVQFGSKQAFSVGDMVQVRGNVKYYPKGGKLTFNALKIELCGQGELYKQFLELKEKLGKEGLFDESHKLPIPKFVNSIGVVTSAKGAVLQDIKNVTSRRNPNLDIYVYDAQVQGKFAVQDVIDGIMYFDNWTDVDVIVVARGGGSLEDLFAFNDEELARIAYICNKPLISAVGHETDFSILDFVADLRAPTPSAAAELVTFDSKEMKQYVNGIYRNINSLLTMKLDELNSSYSYSIMSIERNANSLVNEEIVRINNKVSSFDRLLENKLFNTKYMVDMALNTLDKLNPARLLRSGYSSVTTVDDKNINYKNVSIGDEIKVISKDVKLQATVNYKEKR